MCTTASVQVNTEARACPLAESPRVQCADVVRKRLAVLAKNADVAPVHIDVLGLGVAVKPGSLAVGTCELAELVFRHRQRLRLVGVAVDTLPPQLELTVSAGGGGQGFCDPACWIRCHLLIDPLLQTLLVDKSPTVPTQGLAREVGLRIRLNLVHRVIGEVGADNLHAGGRDVLRIKFADLVMVLGALQDIEVPESLTRVGTFVTTSAGAFCPLLFRQVLRQFVLLGVLDGHAGDLVAAPFAIALRDRGGSRQREDTSCRLVHQTVLVRQVFRKLRPDADLLALLIALAPVITGGQTNRRIRIKVTGHAERIGVRSHLEGEVTVGIALGVVHGGGVLSVFSLVPLGVDLNALHCLARGLNLIKTNQGLYDLLHGTGDGALLGRLARGVDGFVATARGGGVLAWSCCALATETNGVPGVTAWTKGLTMATERAAAAMVTPRRRAIFLMFMFSFQRSESNK